MKPIQYTVGFPFSGLGAGALGFLQARVKLCGYEATFRSIGGIDNDPESCEDFEMLTGSPALCADIATLTPDELRAFWPECPDVVFSSPPCKANSGLMNKATAQTERYQKMNRLVVDWLRLMFETYEERPKMVLIENVPGIMSRGKKLLAEVKRMLRAEGYVFHEGTHECAEIGGLGALRRRYLLVARLPRLVPPLLYQPPKLRVRGCGEVVGLLPLPEAPEAGPLHTMPRLSWLNWIRLALIPAGGDWRDLPGVLEEGQKRRSKFQRYRVEDWKQPTFTVDGPGTNGTFGVADPRTHWFPGVLGVKGWEDPSATVTGGAGNPTRGPFAVADPRVSPDDPAWRANCLTVRPWDEPGRTVTGASRVTGGLGAVADPRMPPKAREGQYGVRGWDQPSLTITGSASVDNGSFAVADPRLVPQEGNPNMHEGKYRVHGWDQPSKTVTGTGRLGSGAQSVADPRIRTGFDHAYRVLHWTEPSFTIAGKTHPGCGAYTVADPRGAAAWTFYGSQGDPIVVENLRDRPKFVPVFIAEDGTWHRPFTVLDVGVLQGLPARVNGKPLVLAGKRRDGWCERIGNAVPVGAGKAIGTQMLVTLVHATVKGFSLGSTPVWVDRDAPVLDHHHAGVH